MNQLDRQTRAKVLELLSEGMSIRAIARVTGVGKNTVIRLLVDAGAACAAYQDRVLRNLPCKRVQVDEIWSFIGCKQGNIRKAKTVRPDAGDVWTWTAICADTKLLASFYIGDRGYGSAWRFMTDVKDRLAERVQLTSDGHKSYLVAVEMAFGDDIDYAQLQKIYGQTSEGERRYSPAICIGAQKKVIAGSPDPKHISTSFAERQNLTMRMHMRRFTRLTNAFSRKIENHAAAVALHCMFYNFVRIHQTLKMTPAMAAHVTHRLWEMTDIVDVIEAWEARRVRQIRLAA
jgi:IS1 family transposase